VFLYDAFKVIGVASVVVAPTLKVVVTPSDPLATVRIPTDVVFNKLVVLLVKFSVLGVCGTDCH
jgi:hypothetical protein